MCNQRQIRCTTTRTTNDTRQFGSCECAGCHIEYVYVFVLDLIAAPTSRRGVFESIRADLRVRKPWRMVDFAATAVLRRQPVAAVPQPGAVSTRAAHQLCVQLQAHNPAHTQAHCTSVVHIFSPVQQVAGRERRTFQASHCDAPRRYDRIAVSMIEFKASGSTGFTRCTSNPASSDRCRSSGCPQPVSAMMRTCAAHGRARIARHAS